MTVAPMPLAEITTTAIRVLCREIGPVDTARFLNQFTGGLGNYTRDRDDLLGEPTVDELLAEIEQRRSPGSKPVKPRRKPSRSTKRSG